MKKRAFLVCLMVLTSWMAFGQMKTRIAIMDFKPGVGVDNSTVNGLSDMLINSLFSTGHYTVIERSQLDKVFREQGFQKNNVPDEVALKVGKIVGAKALVLGTVNKVINNGLEEYNIDVRVVDAETGEFISTAGVTKTGFDTFRDMMEKLSAQLDSKIYGYRPTKEIDVIEDLFIYPESFDDAKNYKNVMKQCEYLNAKNSYGFSDWRLPTREELEFIMDHTLFLTHNQIKENRWYWTSTHHDDWEHDVYLLKQDSDGDVQDKKNKWGGDAYYMVFVRTEN